MGHQRRGPVGRGYMPKGGVPAAQASNARFHEERAAAALAAESASTSTDPGGPAAARTRGGRAITVEGLALIGAVAGCSALLGELVRIIAS